LGATWEGKPLLSRGQFLLSREKFLQGGITFLKVGTLSLVRVNCLLLDLGRTK
jgi:hypothetical protein